MIGKIEIPKKRPIRFFLVVVLKTNIDNKNVPNKISPIDLIARIKPKHKPSKKNWFLLLKKIFIIIAIEKFIKEKNSDSVSIVFEKET